MKLKITILLLLTSVLTFSQEEYETILLDGKEAYMSKKTGEIIYNNPFKKTTYSNKSNTHTNTKNSGLIKHKIEHGETLTSLSRNYGSSVKDICDLNNLDPNSTLYIGQEISITVLDESNSHLVKYGDTLYSISKIYNLTVDKLKDINNLASNKILIGQKLKIQ
ncbi:LysM peptidoglycan-binding domain-containing protein [Urechidicola croceus]|uniref:LysM domain-containing protein n=1 Tax=Urechidicola croceus TaxID=1850246 RepID=A0A1D8PAI2_9FLAO|nr:LysM peptidoglycan-binding domain-containing protein [Urechidicola croceus]AOW21567.1 hypothetical protein LPB138_13160 [Urechidicola croceus]